MSQLDSMLRVPVRLAALTSVLDAVVVPFHVALYGAVGDGVTDDTAAILAAVADWQASTRPGCIQFENRDYLITQPISLTVAADEYLTIEGNNAKLIFGASFTGIGIHITMLATGDLAEYKLPGMAINNLTFSSGWATPAINTALRIETQNAGTGQQEPSVSLYGITINSTNHTGDWAFGVDIFSCNVTRTARLVGTLNSPGSTLMRIDTLNQISVVHAVQDVIMSGGGTALMLGHEGATGPLQGVNVLNFNVGCVNGILWYGAQNDDQLCVTNGQIACSGYGIYAESLTSIIISGVYFLQCGTAIKLLTDPVAGAVTSHRHSIVGNIFYAGVPFSQTLPNYCIVLQDVNSGPDAGTIISGNTFTNLFGPPTGTANASPIQITGNSNYVTVVGNTFLGQVGVNDTSGNPNNYCGANLEGGVANAFYFRESTYFDKGLQLGAGASKSNLLTDPTTGEMQLFSPTAQVRLLNGKLRLSSGTSADNYIANNAGNLTFTAPVMSVGQAGTAIGFFGHSGATQTTVTGSKASGAALTSLISALVGFGFIVDGTSA